MEPNVKAVELRDLWKRYKVSDDQQARERLVVAYSPLGQGSLLRRPTLATLSRRLKIAPVELALGWLLRTPDVIAIPESADVTHVRANRGAASARFDAAALAAIDEAFPPPAGPTPLAVI